MPRFSLAQAPRVPARLHALGAWAGRTARKQCAYRHHTQLAQRSSTIAGLIWRLQAAMKQGLTSGPRLR